MTVLFTELNRITFTALYRTFSTSHSIDFFYGLILLSFTMCNRINYVFLRECIDGTIKVMLMLYIFSWTFQKSEFRKNMYSAKISTFTVDKGDMSLGDRDMGLRIALTWDMHGD